MFTIPPLPFGPKNLACETGCIIQGWLHIFNQCAKAGDGHNTNNGYFNHAKVWYTDFWVTSV